MRFVDLTWPVRLAWLIVGAMWFIWLGVEDRGVGVVLLLGTVISFSASLTGLDRWASRKALSGHGWWLRWILQGVVCAIGIGPMALLLLAIKVSLHSHGIPDFTLASVRQVLVVWPVWGLAALLVSLGFGALARARFDQVDR